MNEYDRNFLVLIAMTIAMIFAVALVISGCFPPAPPQVTVIYSVFPIDPPMQPVDDEDCVTIGFDGLACRDTGMRL